MKSLCSSSLWKGVTILLQLALLCMALRNLWSLPPGLLDDTGIAASSTNIHAKRSVESAIPHSLQAFHAQTKQTKGVTMEQNKDIPVEWKNVTYSVQRLTVDNQQQQSNLTLSDNDITLATFLHNPSQEELAQLHQIVDRWKGPISVAIPLSITKSSTTTARSTSLLSPSTWQTLADKWAPQVTLSLVSIQTNITSTSTIPPTIPTSKLFQVALDNSPTSLVLTMDAHSLPSPHCYEMLKQQFILPPSGQDNHYLRQMQLKKVTFVLPSVRETNNTNNTNAGETTLQSSNSSTTTTNHTITNISQSSAERAHQGHTEPSAFGVPWYFPSSNNNSTDSNSQTRVVVEPGSSVLSSSFINMTLTAHHSQHYDNLIPFHYGWDPHATLVYRYPRKLPQFDDATPVRGAALQRTAWAETLDAHGYRFALVPQSSSYQAYVMEQSAFSKGVQCEYQAPPSEAIIKEYQAFQKTLPNRYQTHADVTTIRNLPSWAHNYNCSKNVGSAEDLVFDQVTCAWKALTSSPVLLRLQIPNIRVGEKVNPDDLKPKSQSSITLVLHTSVAQMPWLLLQAERWTGPCSIAVWITSTADITNFTEFYNQHSETSLRRMSFHFLLDKSKVLDPTMEPIYPVNHLRNCALRFATTKFVVVSDNHIILSGKSFQYLAKVIGTNNQLRQGFQKKMLLAIPAFYKVGATVDNMGNISSISSNGGTSLPSRKDDLRQGMLMRHVAPMNGQEEMDLAHFFTYSKHTTVYQRPWSPGLIPHIVATRRTNDLPWFWTGFRSNALQQTLGRRAWIEEAQVSGYELAVSKQLFGYSLVGSATPLLEEGTEAKVDLEHEYDRVFATYLQMKAQDLEWKQK